MTTPAHSPENADNSDKLVRILSVEPVEKNFFVGIATPEGKGRSFGGQVIGQALMAATGTVDAERSCHSLHGYFMRPGDATKAVLYRVERDFDGRSFCTRRVVAVQDGKPILNLAASFHLREEGLAHQEDMPDVPPPEDLENENVLVERLADRVPEEMKAFIRLNRPIELRPVYMRPPFEDGEKPARQYVWLRTKGSIGEDPALHRAALAYTSDMGLLGVALMRHGRGFGDPNLQVASLDHAMWIHDDFRMDDWLLYAQDSPWTGRGRAFTRGRIFTRDGRMIANVAQEGLIRDTTP